LYNFVFCRHILLIHRHATKQHVWRCRVAHM